MPRVTSAACCSPIRPIAPAAMARPCYPRQPLVFVLLRILAFNLLRCNGLRLNLIGLMALALHISRMFSWAGKSYRDLMNRPSVTPDCEPQTAGLEKLHRPCLPHLQGRCRPDSGLHPQAASMASVKLSWPLRGAIRAVLRCTCCPCGVDLIQHRSAA